MHKTITNSLSIMSSTDCAPIVIFAYNRPAHLRQTLYHLSKNTNIIHSDVYIFVDGIRDLAHAKPHNQVIEIANSFSASQSLTVLVRPTNLGLKDNIISGLNRIFDLHESAIILEDDIEVSPYFLDYMNFCLEYYKNDDSVWHINSWHPVPSFTRISYEDIIVSKSIFMSCWGWATWRDNWNHLIIEPKVLIDSLTPVQKIKLNHYGSSPLYSHLLSNLFGIRHTWAIFWFSTIIYSRGYSVIPNLAFSMNAGLDGSGTHIPDRKILKQPLIRFLSSKQINIDFILYLYFCSVYSFSSRLKSFLVLLLPSSLIKYLRFFVDS